MNQKQHSQDSPDHETVSDEQELLDMDEFITLATHQLRTPATAVKQYIGMLLGGHAGPLTDQQLKFLQSAYDSNERELQIIMDLPHMARRDSEAPVQREKTKE